MRWTSGILLSSGLGALAVSSLSYDAVAIAGACGLLILAWVCVLLLRWPAGVHTVCLGVACALSAVGGSLGVPVWVAAFGVTATLYAWDLAIMDLRMAVHPRESTQPLGRRYVLRNLALAVGGFVSTLLVELVHVHSSVFAVAFAASCACLFLFLSVLRRARILLSEVHPQDEQADG